MYRPILKSALAYFRAQDPSPVVARFRAAVLLTLLLGMNVLTGWLFLHLSSGDRPYGEPIGWLVGIGSLSIVIAVHWWLLGRISRPEPAHPMSLSSAIAHPDSRVVLGYAIVSVAIFIACLAAAIARN